METVVQSIDEFAITLRLLYNCYEHPLNLLPNNHGFNHPAKAVF